MIDPLLFLNPPPPPLTRDIDLYYVALQVHKISGTLSCACVKFQLAFWFTNFVRYENLTKYLLLILSYSKWHENRKLESEHQL